jgi:hypothetical protein
MCVPKQNLGTRETRAPRKNYCTRCKTDTEYCSCRGSKDVVMFAA